MRHSMLKVTLAALALSLVSACSYLPPWAGGPTPPPANMNDGIESASMKITEPKHATAELGELRFEVESENVARAQGCAVDPLARLLDKGPGFETYTVACNNAQMIVIRCDFSYCHPAQ